MIEELEDMLLNHGVRLVELTGGLALVILGFAILVTKKINELRREWRRGRKDKNGEHS